MKARNVYLVLCIAGAVILDVIISAVVLAVFIFVERARRRRLAGFAVSALST